MQPIGATDSCSTIQANHTTADNNINNLFTHADPASSLSPLKLTVIGAQTHEQQHSNSQSATALSSYVPLPT